MTEPMTAARTEREALCDLFDQMGPDAATLCSPWRTRDLAAHLVLRERRPDLAAGLFVPALSPRLERAQRELADTDWAALVSSVRSGPPFWHPARLSAVDGAVNTMEFVIHHEDVLRGDGEPRARREVPGFVADATWAALGQMARMFPRKVEAAVDLKTPGRKTIRAGRGPAVTVSGEPVDIALYLYGRKRAADVSITGDERGVLGLERAKLGI
jgi:uncharacterized protein (TIGR03085 family)